MCLSVIFKQYPNADEQNKLYQSCVLAIQSIMLSSPAAKVFINLTTSHSLKKMFSTPASKV